MRAIILGLFPLLILGCSNGNTRVEVATRRPPAGWRGVFVLAPAEIVRQDVKAYSQILFLGSKAQVMAFDRETPHWGWTATVSAAPTKGESFQVKCESIAVFSTEGKNHIVYQQRQGAAGSYLSTVESEQKTADKLLHDSARLDAVVPKALRQCEEGAVNFHPEVLKGGLVTLVSDQGELRFLPHDADAFREMVRGLPEPVGKLESWETPKAFSRAQGGLYASLSNRYLPLAQTHRFYRLRLWTAEAREGGGLAVKGAVASRPSPTEATTGWGKNDFLYNQIERGEWLEPVPTAVRLFLSENGVERAPETVELATGGNEMVLKTAPTTGRLEIVYGLSDRPDREVVQEIRIGSDGKLTVGDVQLRQK